LPHLTYIRMVIDEAMRLYPPVWLLGRRAIAADTVAGYDLPAGALIAISPYAVHRHPAYWDEPTRFDPSRFAPQPQAAQPRFAYLPFGGGARQCIGNRFALMELQLVLATLLPHVRLRLANGYTATPEPLLNLRPLNGMWLSVTARS
jgi:cytochrome P450